MTALTMSDIIDIAAEFVEVAIHQILFVRGLYPKEIFVIRQKYNAPVHMSRHPDINKYINHVVAACKDGIQQRIVKAVSLVVVDSQQNPIERFVFELNSIFALSPHQNVDSVTTELLLPELELQLRAFLLRIDAVNSLLQPLAHNSKFSVVVDMEKSLVPASLQEKKTGVTPWIPADDGTKCDAFSGSNLIPLKSVDTGVLQMNLFVQERNV
ncbi:DNA-binding protein [Umbelopsis sp. PMI_123]|nr:DNA-binding protein [Umbelopsis sp. PMI_123]